MVNTTIDGTGSPSGDLSLRQAVNLANVLGADETITFDSALFATPRTIALTQGQLDLSDTGAIQTITAPAAGVTVSGGGISGVFQVDASVTATITGLTIIDGNSSYGGGIDNAGTLTVTNSTLADNSAGILGGGIDNAGTLTVAGSALSGNSAFQFGGSIYNSGTVTVTNSTLSGNSAEYGAGIDNSGTVTVTNSTLAGNSVQDAGGGINNGGTVTLANTIVAGNTNPSGASDLSGTSASGSFNLIGTGGAGGLQNGVNGNIVLTSLTGLDLAPLGDYGGPTQTIALLPGSPAAGAGNEADTGVNTDQRGMPLDNPPDIGAFQTQPELVVNITIDGTGSPSGGMSCARP